jgi:transposase InsO family protein
LRNEHTTWGARKLKDVLTVENPGTRWPAASTIGEILDREGLLQKRTRKRVQTAFRDVLSVPQAPNDVWAMDYKGEFRLGNSRYCYPLTVSDLFSRHVHACEAFERIHTDDAWAVFEEIFDTHGLPSALRSDNGPPFAAPQGLFGLTRLSAWFLALGIRLERILPGHPQQNGCHERMHRTLKAEACRPAEPNCLRQQQRFDQWRQTFNHRRPHEALDRRVPAAVYAPSARRYTKPQLRYPLHDDALVVRSCGHLRLFRGRRRTQVYVSAALSGYPIGIRELDSGHFLLTFATLDLGTVDPVAMTFHRADEAPGHSPDPCNL